MVAGHHHNILTSESIMGMLGSHPCVFLPQSQYWVCWVLILVYSYLIVNNGDVGLSSLCILTS